MSGPVVIKDDLSGESLAGVQTLISTYMNTTAVTVPLSGTDGPSTDTTIQTLTAARGQETPACQDHDDSGESQVCCMEPAADEDKKCNICIIEKGQLLFPEEKEKFLVDRETGSFINADDEAKVVECEDLPDDDDDVVVTDEPIAPGKNEPRNVHKTKHVPGSENTRNYKAYSSYDSEPKVERLDNDVMNKLLDYYRKFNERQLGLTVDEEAPGYKASAEPPTEVLCGNDIIKEAVIRVGQSQEAGAVVKEPTIVEPTPPVNEKLAKLYSQCHIGIDMSDEKLEAYCDDLSRNNWRYSEHYECKDEQSYEDQWIYGANFIEKALQRRIDESRQSNASNKKWDQNDIVNLVEMLSKKRARAGRKGDREWSRGTSEPIYEDCRDDLLYQIEEINGHIPQEDENTLFMQLKRGPANNDRQDLRDVVNENSYRYRNSIPVSKRRQVYYGGDELVVAMEYVRNVFNLSWLWSAYDTVVGSWFKRNRHQSANPDDEDEDQYEDDDNKWFRWTVGSSSVRSLTGWFSSVWRFGRVGKPIYKQVEYQDTDVISWHKRFTNDVENCRMVKNRKMRNIPEETVVDFHPNLNYTSSEPTIPKSAGLSCIETDHFSEEGSHLPDVIRQARRTDRDCVVTMDT